MLSYRKNDNEFNNKRTMNNSGFTLVEMIVTFVVLGILMAISVMSLMAWQDWADFNRQNEYAETLFLSAQNQLSEYSANGTLGEFSKRAYEEEHNNKVDLNSIYYAEGETFTSELKKENSVWTSKEAGTLCYAMAFKGDYAKYMAGEETSSPTADIVFELVEEYVYDTSILNETICIEFSLEDGQVFSAFYTDKFTNQDDTEYEAFEYNNDNDALRGLVNIATRYEEYRKERMVGYYGVDTLSAALVSKTDKPTISKIYLNNEETLNLSFKLGKYANATNQLTYEIGVVDTKINKKVLNIVLDTSTHSLKNYENREAVPCKVTRYVYDDEGNATAQDLGTLDIIAYLDKDNQVRVVLDAVDAKATTYQYKTNTASLTDADSIKNNTVQFADTFSFHRFGLNTEDIYCTLQGYGVMYKATSTKQSNSSNVYFATGKEVEDNNGSLDSSDNYYYTIKNARHLNNIRYIEDLGENGVKAYRGTEDDVTQTYLLADNIDWKKFVEDENYYLSKASNISLPASYYEAKNVNIITNTSFASIDRLQMRDKLIGSGRTISGLNINEAFNTLSGLYGYDTKSNTSGVKAPRAAKAAKAPANTEAENKITPIGLFNTNYGTINTVNLDNIQVKSNKDRVGAFCGVNVSGALSDGTETGILTELKVLNTGINTDDASVILGREHVGGIVGYLQGVGDEEAEASEAHDVTLSKLTNEAKVTGDKFVGGIVGEVRTSKDNPAKILIKDCVNNGAVMASNTEMDENGEITVKTTDRTSAKYIGGITGYTANVYANNHLEEEGVQELIKLSNCVSTPVYSDHDLAELLDDSVENAAEVLESKLNGVYVGGIVGYNYYSTIEGCTTKSSNGKKGYVFGYQYVGGIVGFNQGPTSGIKGGDEDVSGVNEANVVGYEYVGGITGCNADVNDDKVREDALEASIISNVNDTSVSDNEILEKADFSVTPATDKNPENKIENWVNKGVIFATGRYAGGISGYNSGWIYNCNSEVESDSVDGFFQSTYSNGDYAGGIAGYNNGIIGNTKRNSDSTLAESPSETNKISATCYISGKNYVGGIVGYNDVDAIVEDYELIGGYILGDEEDSAFIGGYAGFNSSLRLLMDDDNNARYIVSSPNEVVGEYFVGGSVGGNIINTYGVDLPKDNNGKPIIPTMFKTDNFLGTIYGKAFVGGFFGYNMITDTPSLTYDGESDLDVSFVIQQNIVDGFNTSDAGVSTSENKLKEKTDILNNIYNGAYGNITNSNATMYISGTENNTTQNSFGRIEADIFIGGVFGYNDDNTIVYVKDVENTTPIIADKAIEYNEQNGRNTDYVGRDYTYSYSYAGGIVGKVSKNMTIDNCSNAASGTVTTNGTYTGGIAEINEGSIINCKANTFGSSVDDYVGGICGLNKSLGTIDNCTADDITVSGCNVVAGVVAENFGTIANVNVNKLSLLVSGKDFIDTNTGEVAKDGTAAGIAAYNAGTINIGNDIVVDISSKGNYVGAVAAINDGNGTIQNTKIKDSLNIDADRDAYDEDFISIKGNIDGLTTVGGVIGKNISNNTEIIIAGFSNDAVVTATKGTAGGIVGDNASGNVIAFCENHEVVTAANAGNAGGITSTNSSKITKCNNYAEIKAASGMSGGITAVNNEGALISYCLVEPEYKDSKLNFASKDAVGGISALNNGSIEYITLNNVNVYNYTTSGVSNIGVVTGINDKNGVIKFAATIKDEAGHDIKAIDKCTAKTYTDYSFVGGVAGTNNGVIMGAELDSNSLPTTVIESEVGFMPNSAKVAVMGGVAGVNYNKITNIGIDGNVIGDLGGDTVGYGGIAGINGYLTSAEAKSAGYDKYDDTSYLAVISYCTFDGEVFAEGSGAGIARIGGITGNNGYGGDIEHCYLGVRNDGDGVSTDADGSSNTSRVTKIYAGMQEDANGNPTKDTTVGRNYDVEAFGRNYGVDVIRTAYDKTSYAHIGGMAGTNYGRVKECDNYSKSKITGNEAVKIYAFTCVSGGIVGYSYQGSVIEGSKDEPITTGINWEIKARSSDNDRGNGGIVGIYSSANDLAYLDNYADVTCVYQTNPCVGGIAGFIDQRDVTDLTISNATNHGYILSYNRAGGMIGLLAYSGIRFENCINYGEVRSLHTSAAGFIQYSMHIPTDIVFMGCYNHGNIITFNNRGAGYISDFGALNGASLRFVDCVNTGIIGRINDKDTRIRYADGSNNEVDISGLDAEDEEDAEKIKAAQSAGKADTGKELDASAGFSYNGGTFTNCRNYSNKMIFALSYTGINAKDCFDASGTDVVTRNPDSANVFVPFANTYSNKNNTRNNYFISKDNNASAYKQYGVYASIATGKLLREEYTNTIKSFYEPANINKRFYYTGNITTNISFDFKYDDNSAGIDSLVVYFSDYNEDSKNSRYYDYECILYDAEGGLLTTITSGDNPVWVKNCNILDDGLTKISFGEYAGDKTVARAVLHTTFYNAVGGDIQPSRFHGFGYVPFEDTETISYFNSANRYYGKTTDTYMTLDMEYVPYNPDNSNTKVLNDNLEAYLYDYTAFISYNDTSRWAYNLPQNTYERCTFNISYGEKSKGLDKLYFIPTTQNGKAFSDKDKTDSYAYYAVFTDEDGNKFYDGTADEPNTIANTEQQSEVSYVGVQVPSDCESKVVTVELYFKCTTRGRTWINIRGFRWQEKDNPEMMLIPYDNSAGYYYNFLSSVYSELVVDKNEEGNLILYPPFITEDKVDRYSIVLENNNPWNRLGDTYTFFDDKVPYDDAYDLSDGSWDYNTRVGVFKELDPKFEEYLYSSTYNPDIKLDMTNKFWLDTNNSRGKYRIKWNSVINAVGYITYYTIEDEKGEIIYTSDEKESVVTTDNELYHDYDASKIYNNFAANNKNESKTYKIHFYVKAVSAYHKLHEGEEDQNKNDSDYSELIVDGKQLLPMPEYHFEFIEGNKAVVVIDNFEEFEAIPNYGESIEIVVESSNIFDGLNKLTIDMSKGRAYSEPFVVTNLEENQNKDITIFSNYRTGAYAQPKTDEAKNIYMTSAYSYLSGGLLGSRQHYRRNAETNDIYVITTNFKGFYGNTNDAMTYNTELVANNIDVYTVADIVAYDETLGVPVAYDRGNIHTASKEGGANANFTVSLSGLPSDIIGREFEVRSYLYATQSYIMYMGHDVEKGVTLSSIDDVKDIKDKYYYNTEGIIATDTDEGPQSIYDDEKKALKPGYVIYDNQDGTYDIYYSSSIAMDDMSVASGEEKGLYNVRRMTYYPHGEDENDASDGYGYYLAKDLRENRNINNTWTYGYNVASMVFELKPYKHEVIGRWNSGGKKYANVRFYFKWNKLYDDETFGYMFIDDTNNNPTRANQNNIDATTYSYNLGIVYEGSDITEDEIEAFYNEHLKFILRRRDQYIQPKPVLETNYTIGEDADGHSIYTFEWDKNLNDYKYDGAEYSVTLVGKTINGEEVPLNTPEVVNTNSIEFKDTNDNWNFNRFILTVNRIGTKDDTDRAIILPSSATGEYKCKQRLTQLSPPTAVLHSETANNGHSKFDKSGLLYDVTWGPITDSDELMDLGGYLITVSVKEGSEVKPHYYYVQDIENSSVDDTIGIDVAALTDNGGKVIDLSNDRNSSYDENYIGTYGRHKAIIDLSDFAGKDVLNITVKAIARSNAENFMDGKESREIEITLPDRLKTPDLTKMSRTLPDDISSDGTLAISSVNTNGITLTYSEDGRTESGTYKIAIAIYDNKPENDDVNYDVAIGKKQVEYAGDKYNAGDEGYWNSGAIYTYLGKSDEKNMSGTTLANATYTIKESGNFKLSDYAGKWMKVTIKASTNNNIDSWWTDEDPDSEDTLNYYWIQIPMAKLDSVNITDSDNVSLKYYYSFTTNEWYVKDPAETLAYLEIEHETFDFETQDYADGYIVKIVGLENQTQYIYIVPDTADTFKVYGFYAENDDTAYIEYIDNLSNVKSNNEFNPYVIDYGILNLDEDVAVSTYKYTLEKGGNLLSNENVGDLDLAVRLRYSGGKINIILPDIIKMESNSNQSVETLQEDYNITSAVTVSAVAGEDNKDNYADSYIEGLFRQNGLVKNWDKKTGLTLDDVEGIGDIIQIEGDISIDPDLTVDVSEREYYKITFRTNDLTPAIYRILVVNSQTNELVCEKYSVVSKPVNDEYDNHLYYKSDAAMPKEYFDEAETYRVIISAAKFNDNGISEWSDSYYLDSAGIGSNVDDEIVGVDDQIVGSSPDMSMINGLLNINLNEPNIATSSDADDENVVAEPAYIPESDDTYTETPDDTSDDTPDNTSESGGTSEINNEDSDDNLWHTDDTETTEDLNN